MSMSPESNSQHPWAYPSHDSPDVARLQSRRRCFRGVGLLCSLGVRESEHPLPESSDVMILQVLHCPHCQGTDIIRHGTTRQGKQRYRCQENACKGRTFLLDYTYAGHSAGAKQQIIDMAMNASGIRDTARVLHVSPTTVIKELKKKSRRCSRCIMRCWRSCIPSTSRWKSGARMRWRCVVD